MGSSPTPRGDAPVIVAVAVEQPLLREGLRLLVTGEPMLTLAAVARSPADIHARGLDVIVVDVPSDLHEWVEGLERARAAFAAARIVGLHDGLAPSAFGEAIAAGVSVLVDVASGPDAIVAAIAGTRRRSLRRWVPPQLGVLPLTTRERAVLELIARGRTSAELAGDLGITTNTVERHKRHVFAKLGVTNQAHAVAAAVRAGLIERTPPSGNDRGGSPHDAEVIHASATIMGASSLLADSVARVLAAAGIELMPAASAAPPSLAVLVGPANTHWESAQERGLDVLALVAHEPDGEELLALVSRGAHAVLPTDCDPAYLVVTLLRVVQGDTGLTRSQTRRLAEALRARERDAQPRAVTLTPREREILQTLDDGLSLKQAALALGISPRTVENTRRVLYRKLGVRNRAQSIARAHAIGALGGQDGR